MNIFDFCTVERCTLEALKKQNELLEWLEAHKYEIEVASPENEDEEWEISKIEWTREVTATGQVKNCYEILGEASTLIGALAKAFEVLKTEEEI